MPIIKFHITAEELRELDKENDKKLLELLKYMRRRIKKKVKEGWHYLDWEVKLELYEENNPGVKG